jgi:hypothetical protein
MNRRHVALALVFAAGVFLPAVAHAQYHSSITFENGAGQSALVKLVGPDRRTISVPESASRRESGVAPGRYYLLVRYGDREGHYTYTKGDPFEVVEAGDQYSEISITLYVVTNGNYGSRPARKEDFDRVQ